MSALLETKMLQTDSKVNRFSTLRTAKLLIRLMTFTKKFDTT